MNKFDINFINRELELVVLDKGIFEHPISKTDTVEITKPSFGKSLTKTIYDNFYIVNEETKMRSDVISLLTTSSEKNADIIMRYNEIANPFSIEVGDVILIPSNISDIRKDNPTSQTYKTKAKNNIYDSVKKEYNKNFNDRNSNDVPKNTLEDFKKKYTDIENNKDYDIFKNLSSKGVNPTKDFLPPVFSDDNKKEMKILPNGDIIPGESVVSSKNGCEVKFSKAELINKLVKSRIKRG